MTEPVVIDQQTRDELTPPCDAGRTPCACALCQGRVTDRHRCDQPAAETVTGACERGHHRASFLLCHGHATEADHAMRHMRCRLCAAPGRVERTPL